MTRYRSTVFLAAFGSAIALTLLTGAAVSTSFAVEGVLDGMPDPSIIQDEDGSFYIFATGEGLPIYRSENLVDWMEVDRVFADPVPLWAQNAIPGAEGIWAPEIVRMNGRYFVYYSVSTFGSQRSLIGVAVSDSLDPDSPDYGWEDLGLLVESYPGETPFNAIDGAAFQDEDRRAYFTWGPMHTGPVAVEPGEVHGTWRISINYEGRGEIVDIIPEGRIGGSHAGSWSLEGMTLNIQTVNEYKVMVEPGGNSFTGRTAAGETIRGVKVNERR